MWFLFGLIIGFAVGMFLGYYTGAKDEELGYPGMKAPKRRV